MATMRARLFRKTPYTILRVPEVGGDHASAHVVAMIVKALRNEGPTRKTQLALTTGLSYDSLVRYLGWMGERGFVVLDADDKVVLTP